MMFLWNLPSRTLQPSMFFLFWLSSLHFVKSQVVGDQICVEGFVMDKFCIDRGTLLDKPNLASLQFPHEHSLHCLLDVQSCYESPFIILRAPADGSDMYSLAYQVDDVGRDLLISLGRAAGRSGSYPACRTCTNDSENGLLVGFRAEVFGTITADSVPPLLNVSMAFASNGRDPSEICAAVAQPIAVAPTAAPVISAPIPAPPTQTTPAPVATVPTPTAEAPISDSSVPISANPIPPTTIIPVLLPSGIPPTTNPTPSIPPDNFMTGRPSDFLSSSPSPKSNSSSSPSWVPTESPILAPLGGMVPVAAPNGSQNFPDPTSASPHNVNMIAARHLVLHCVITFLTLQLFC